jgi:outer membrane usher protein
MGRRDLVFMVILGGFAQRIASAGLPESTQETLLAVTVNGDAQPSWALVELADDGTPWVRRADLVSWGLKLTEDSVQSRLTPDSLVPLNALPGVHASVDRAVSIMTVEVQPALLNKHEFHNDQESPRVTPSPLGLFLNYDIGVAQQSGSTELRANSEFGIVRDNWVARSSWFDSTAGGQGANLRLDSNVTADFPATRTSMQWGDTFARLGTNADAVRIAGMSWGTDFSVTPSFITVPLPTFSNATASPGTVDLYVNGAKTQQLSVPAGPFSISGVPVTTGAGELTVVTRDLLGHTQTFTQAYYIAPQMLQSGLTAWDMQVGTERLDYGSASDAYSGWLAAGGQRIGITDRLTEQWRVEADKTGAAVSGQWLALLPNNSLLSLGPSCAAVSGDFGCLVDVGYERDLSRLGYGSDLQYATVGYEPVAAALRTPAARWRLYSHVQTAPGDGFSFLAGGTWQELNGAHSLAISLTASKTWFGGGHLDFIVSHTSGNLNSSFVTLVYTHTLGKSQTISVNGYRADGQNGGQVSVQRNLPPGEGYGYLVRLGQDSSTNALASVQWNGSAMALAALEQREDNVNYLSAEMSGAAFWVDDNWFLARHVDRSFALIHATDLPGVPVYLNDQEVARTDANGIAVLPDLRPFEINKIDLDPTSLPLALDVPQTRFEVTPYRRGGAYIEVPVRLAANVRLQQSGGATVPPGARIFLGDRSVPVGNDGRAYIEGAAGDHELRITWDRNECRTHLMLPVQPSSNPIDDAVPLVCVASH